MKSPIAALILAKSKPKTEDATPVDSSIEGGDSGSGSELEIAGGDCVDAIKSGDAKAFTAALKNFIMLNESSESESPAESSAPTDMGDEAA